MSADDPEPWHRLERAALGPLTTAPAERDGGGLTLLLRTWERPAFAPWRTWFVLRTGRRHGERILVHRATWARDVGRERVPPLQVARLGPCPEPTLLRAEREVAATAWQERFAAFPAGLAVPLAVSRSVVVDGRGHGLLLPARHGVAVDLQWHGDVPPEWRPLDERVRALRGWLDGTLAGTARA